MKPLHRPETGSGRVEHGDPTPMLDRRGGRSPVKEDPLKITDWVNWEVSLRRHARFPTQEKCSVGLRANFPRGSVRGFLLHQHFHRLFHGEATRPLTWRELAEGRNVLADYRLGGNEDPQVFDEPPYVVAGLDFRPLEWVGDAVEQLGCAQGHEWLHPDLQAMRRLFHENHFILIVAQPSQVAIIGPVEELAALVRTVAGQQIALLVAIQVHFVNLVAGAVAFQKPALDVGSPAAAMSVGSQSSAEKMSLISVRGCTRPGHRISAGTR